MKSSLYLILLLMLSAFALAEDYNFCLYRSVADDLYCQQNGFCNLTQLNVNNVTIYNTSIIAGYNKTSELSNYYLYNNGSNALSTFSPNGYGLFHDDTSTQYILQLRSDFDDGEGGRISSSPSLIFASDDGSYPILNFAVAANGVTSLGAGAISSAVMDIWSGKSYPEYGNGWVDIDGALSSNNFAAYGNATIQGHTLLGYGDSLWMPSSWDGVSTLQVNGNTTILGNINISGTGIINNSLICTMATGCGTTSSSTNINGTAINPLTTKSSRYDTTLDGFRALNLRWNESAIFGQALDTPTLAMGIGANYLLQTEDFTSSSWTLYNITATANVVSDPSNISTTAERIFTRIASPSGAAQYNGMGRINQTISNSVNTTWTFSISAKTIDFTSSTYITMSIGTNASDIFGNATKINCTLDRIWRECAVTTNITIPHTHVTANIFTVNNTNISLAWAQLDPSPIPRNYPGAQTTSATYSTETGRAVVRGTLGVSGATTVGSLSSGPISGSTGTFTSTITSAISSIALQFLRGFTIGSNTAATSSATQQNSPLISLYSRSWNGTADKLFYWNAQALALNTTSSIDGYGSVYAFTLENPSNFSNFPASNYSIYNVTVTNLTKHLDLGLNLISNYNITGYILNSSSGMISNGSEWFYISDLNKTSTVSGNYIVNDSAARLLSLNVSSINGGTPINSINILSQSVSYADSAGSCTLASTASTLDMSGSTGYVAYVGSDGHLTSTSYIYYDEATYVFHAYGGLEVGNGYHGYYNGATITSGGDGYFNKITVDYTDPKASILSTTNWDEAKKIETTTTIGAEGCFQFFDGENTISWNTITGDWWYSAACGELSNQRKADGNVKSLGNLKDGYSYNFKNQSFYKTVETQVMSKGKQVTQKTFQDVSVNEALDSAGIKS